MSVAADMFAKLPLLPSMRGKVANNVDLGFDLDDLDPVLTIAFISLLTIGLIMVASSSISVADRNFSNPFYYLQRQLVFVAMVLVLVLVPGLGKTVNGSTRWLPLGIINLQVSELVKLFVVVYVSGYLVRHGDAVRSSLSGFLKPMVTVGFVGLLLLMEPDFGATVVIMGTVLGMTFLAGARFFQFISFVFIFVCAALLLVVTSPYRMQRITSFANPWADPFDSGFQLTQSLIAVGTGGWFGTGLGGSVQKLFYLPESHTDFLFAVLSEELGFVGVFIVVMLYGILFFRSFKIASQAEDAGNYFAAYMAYGIGIWLSMQAIINMGVNIGLLPTKGLTLPLMSYGGSSLIVCCIAVGLLMRIHYETNGVKKQASKKLSGKAARKLQGNRKQKSRSSAPVSRSYNVSIKAGRYQS
jgi:cell division protein FtsW